MSFITTLTQLSARTVALLITLITLAGCTQSFDNENAFTVTPSEEKVSINISYWESQCSTCHNDVINNPSTMGNLSIWRNKDIATLADRIALTMPMGNVAACQGDCATETARFIQAKLTGKTIVDSNNIDDSNNGDNGSGSDIDDNNSDGSNTGNSGTDQDNVSPNNPNPVITIPAAPSQLAASKNASEATLRWKDNSNNEQEFIIWRKVGANSWAAYASVNANTLQFVDKDLAKEVITYQVSARNSAGSSVFSNTVSIDNKPSPETPVNSCTAPQYVAGNAYSSGQQVQNNGQLFECKSGVAAWCSSASKIHYEPGKGFAWQEAWTSKGECSSNGSTTPEPEQPVVSLTAPTFVSQLSEATNVTLSWLDNATNETGYKVEKSIDQQAWSVVATLPANANQYIDSENTAGSTARYRVFAFSADQQGSATISQGFSFALPSFDAASYYAQGCAGCHGNDGKGTAVYKASFENTTSDLPDLTKIIADTMPIGKVDECTGDCASQMAQYLIDNFITVSNAPAAATNIVVVATSDRSKINISWQDNANNETGFRIERAVNGGNFTAMANVAANQTSTSDTNVTVGNRYQYRITAFNSDASSSPVVSAELLLEANITIPLAPSLASVSLENNQAILSWQDNANNETGYVVQRRQNKGPWGADIVLPANTTEYQDTSVQFGNSYDYRLLATNSAGDSMWSNEATLDMTGSVNKQVYETSCANCHKLGGGGLAIDLTENHVKDSWASKDWDGFLSKVNTMQTANCDADCKRNAAEYLWIERWGFSTETDIASTARGVRGVRLLTSYEYSNTVSDLFGLTIPESRLPADRHSSSFKHASEAQAGVVIYDRLTEFMQLAEYVAENATAAQYGCNNSCTTSQLQSLLERAFRMPIDTAMLNDYVAFQANYGREDLVASILLSPHFLYRSELGEWNMEQQAYQLTPYEAATALAYQIWGTTPDAALLGKAKNGTLSTPQQIATQAELMMADERAAKHLVEFVKYYTNTQRDLAEKPNLPTATIAAMEQERNASVIYALTQGNATLNELFNPGYSFLNSKLANHYQIAGVSASTATKVTVPETRGGLLHQGILQVHNSDFSATSLVKRGAMIRENFMCHHLGVPSGVDPSDIDMPSHNLTTRDRWEVITGPTASEGQCWACHQLMNEPGSVLESFDAAGRYRTTEPAYNNPSVVMPIETAGVLRSNDATEILLSYNTARDLSEYLANSPVGQDCFVDNYVRFATGYDVDSTVKADVNQLQTRFRTEGNIWQLVHDSIKAPSFLYRTER